MASLNQKIQAAIFDMDGVVTRTAQLHSAAWKKTFDDFLAARTQDGTPYQPFDSDVEYRAYVDGKPRLEGVRGFLHARRIAIPAAAEEQLASQKEKLFEKFLCEQGVQVFPSSIELIRSLRANDVKTAVVTSSRHGREILERAAIADLFDARLDGIDRETLGLAGKPDPAMFLHAASMLGVEARHAMVVEDAIAGVQAGYAGKFGLVVGVDRGGNAAGLKAAGADLVVAGLEELTADSIDAAFREHREAIAWRIEQEGFDPARERQMESLFSVGNGYMGVRGALDMPTPGSQGDLFIAGVYDRKYAELPYSEIEFLPAKREPDAFSQLVPFPFPFQADISIGGAPIDFAAQPDAEMRRTLDMKSGVLHVEGRFRCRDGQHARVQARRCASLPDPHLLLQEIRVTTEKATQALKVRSSLDVAELQIQFPHLDDVEHMTIGDIELVTYKTRGSGIRVSMASRSLFEQNVFRRTIIVFTSRDGMDPRNAAMERAHQCSLQDFDSLFAAHSAAWAEYWNAADIRIAGFPALEQALRFGSYHLKLPAPVDGRSSIGARALSGRAYEGHVFWDTEIYMLPFFLHVDPQVARNLLLYRHHTLEGARQRAREFGCRGACYAWESTVTGADVTPDKMVLKSTGREIPIFTGRQQIHITADVAYAVWRYWEATRDEAFLSGPGADILFETARFWASRVARGDKHYHIRGVVGPDEYHYGVDDNAYTNWMARFNLERAAWLAATMGLCKVEAEEWSAIAQSLYIPAPNETGVIEQFAGFFTLEDHPSFKEERLKAPVTRVFEWEEANRRKVVKQADVLMLPLLFPDAFSDEVVRANYDYYAPLTDHGSSLSPSVHAAIAARIGRLDDAERYWKQSLWLDLSNGMNNSTLGIHPAAMGGTWQALIFGFLGIRFSDDGPTVSAHALECLPADWDDLQLNLIYRGKTYPLKLTLPKERRASDESLHLAPAAS